MLTSRRSLLGGIAALIAAPSIVRAGALMPVKVPPLVVPTVKVTPIKTFEVSYGVYVFTPEEYARYREYLFHLSRDLTGIADAARGVSP